MALRLNSDQEKLLWESLLDAFSTESELAQMVRFGGVTRNLAAVAGSGRLNDVVFNLLVWAGAHDKINALILAARNANPTNPLLRAFAEQIGLAPTTFSQGFSQEQLEKYVLKSVRFQNVEQWRERMSTCELAVCRVEIPRGTGIGTGFLVGPDLIMTNHHVIDNVIANPAFRDTVVLRFDYKTTADGTTLCSGEEYHLVTHADWLVDSSPVQQLDYALLRAGNNPGKQPVGGQQRAPARGWLTPVVYQFEMGEPLFIIQHPATAPLKFGPGSITGLKINETSVIYNAPTWNGSSGSPCFNSNWELVALHHFGDPTGNEGVMFSAILTQPKVKAALGI